MSPEQQMAPGFLSAVAVSVMVLVALCCARLMSLCFKGLTSAGVTHVGSCGRYRPFLLCGVTCSGLQVWWPRGQCPCVLQCPMAMGVSSLHVVAEEDTEMQHRQVCIWKDFTQM